MAANKSWILIGLFSRALFALNPDLSLETLASQSLSYEARSLWVNPAALGFQTELNGGQFGSSFTLAKYRTGDDAYAFAFSLSRFGLGVEQIPVTDGQLTRYTLGVGFPVSRSLFLGLRQRFYRGSSPTLTDQNSLDVSFQLRPWRRLSIGGTANTVNRADIVTAFGVTLRPVDILDLSLDYAEKSAGQWRYLCQVALRPFNGLSVNLGYYQTFGFQVGAQITIGTGNLFGYSQPDSADRSATFGIDLSSVPFQKSVQPPSVLKADIDESLSESGIEGTFLSSGKPSFLDLVRKLNRAAEHPRVAGVVIHLKSFPLGLASALELSDAVEALQKNHKKVVVYLGQAGMKEYLIASAAEKIYVEPSGEIRLTGLSVQRYFLKGSLDKVGIEGEFLARGEYKSAPEMFTRKDSSPASKRASVEELRRADQIVAEAMARSIRIKSDGLKKLYSKGIFSPEEAKAEGLVDDIKPFSDFPPSIFHRESLEERIDRLALPDRIAIIPLTGDILEDRNSPAVWAGRDAITPERVDKLLKAAVSDSRTKAIILRISSPGGEVLASRVIAGIIEKAEKPVYVSMGDVAASGGYMISTPGKRIFASPLTYTGSIGVFLGKLNVSELYNKIDLHKEIISDSPTAGLYSEHKAWNAEERALMLSRLNQYYTDFTGYVAGARKLTPTQTEAAAQGRVWLGSAAQSRGLVDELGGLTVAIAKVAENENLTDYTTVVVRPALNLADFFAPPNFVSLGIREEILSTVGGDLQGPLQWASSLRQNPFLYWESTKLVDR